MRAGGGGEVQTKIAHRVRDYAAAGKAPRSQLCPATWHALCVALIGSKEKAASLLRRNESASGQAEAISQTISCIGVGCTREIIPRGNFAFR
jgi:hypothetical protein